MKGKDMAVKHIIRRILDPKITKKTSKWIAKGLQSLIIITGLYYSIYKILNLDLTALAASLGIIGIIIAFSSQQIMQNALAGILIALQRPIRLEDWIEVGFPATGINRVKDIRLTNTLLEDKDGKLIYIPNSLIINSKVINYTQQSFIEIPFQLKVPYSKVDKAKKIILGSIQENQKILPTVSKKENSIIKKILNHNPEGLKDRFNPDILISEISKDDITLNIKFWIRSIEKKDEIVSEFLNSLSLKLKKNKIF